MDEAGRHHALRRRKEAITTPQRNLPCSPARLPIPPPPCRALQKDHAIEDNSNAIVVGQGLRGPNSLRAASNRSVSSASEIPLALTSERNRDRTSSKLAGEASSRDKSWLKYCSRFRPAFFARFSRFGINSSGIGISYLLNPAAQFCTTAIGNSHRRQVLCTVE